MTEVRRPYHDVIKLHTAYVPNTKTSILLMSDIHFDNTHCHRSLLNEHLDLARATNAKVLIIGDLFCLMQSVGDRRSASAEMREGYTVETYDNDVVRDALNFFGPYADLISMVSYGNHEASYARKNSSDVLRTFVEWMNERHGTNMQLMPYEGWIQLSFESTTGGHSKTISGWYHHGAGGGGRVSKGAPKSTYRNAELDGASFVVTGHIHESWDIQTVKRGLDQRGRPCRNDVFSIQLPTYKDEMLKEGEYYNYHTGNERAPRALGAYWFHVQPKRALSSTKWKYWPERCY